MKNKLTLSEIIFIHNLAEYKSDADLAKILGKPVETVMQQVNLLSGIRRQAEPATTPPAPSPKKKKGKKSAKAGKKKPAKSKVKPGSQRDKKAKKAVKIREVVKVQNEVIQRQKAWKSKNERKQFKTKAVDLAGKVAYKLNSKTTVFDNPGADIDELKKKYRIA